MYIRRQQFPVQPVLIRILRIQEVFRQFLLLEQSLAQRCLHGLQERHGLLSYQIGCLAVAEEELNTLRQTGKISSVKLLIFRKTGNVELARGTVIRIDPRHTCAVIHRPDDLNYPLRRLCGLYPDIIDHAAAAEELSAYRRGYARDTAHERLVIMRQLGVCSDLPERDLVLFRRILIHDARQQLPVSVDIDRYPFDRVYDLSRLYIHKHDIAVLGHYLNYKAPADREFQLILSLYIYLDDPL